jgi:hypothetical protein
VRELNAGLDAVTLPKAGPEAESDIGSRASTIRIRKVVAAARTFLPVTGLIFGTEGGSINHRK